MAGSDGVVANLPAGRRRLVVGQLGNWLFGGTKTVDEIAQGRQEGCFGIKSRPAEGLRKVEFRNTGPVSPAGGLSAYADATHAQSLARWGCATP